MIAKINTFMGCQDISLLLASIITILIVFLTNICGWRQNRDHPKVIYRKLLGLWFSGLVSIIILEFNGFHYLHNLVSWPFLDASHLLEITLIPVILTCVLFLGPLFSEIETGLFLDLTVFDGFVKTTRDLVAAPILEEFLYRGVLVKVLDKCFSNLSTVFISSFLFSISHLPYHFQHGEYIGLPTNWTSVLGHLVTTFIFATYACTLTVKSDSIIPAIITHSICNYFTAPRFDELFSEKRSMFITVTGATLFLGLITVYTIYW